MSQTMKPPSFTVVDGDKSDDSRTGPADIYLSAIARAKRARERRMSDLEREAALDALGAEIRQRRI